jgi:hypothetical protein
MQRCLAARLRDWRGSVRIEGYGLAVVTDDSAETVVD